MSTGQTIWRAWCGVWLVGFLVSALPAQAADPEPPALTEEQQTLALRQAESRGQEIFVHDRASAMVSDAVMALPRARKDKRLAGWITERRGDDVVVTFFGSPKGEPAQALYRGTVDASGKFNGNVQVIDPPAPLSDFERAAVAARATAVASGFSPCSKRYNTVILPEGEGTDRHWAVYLLPGTTKRGVVPIGGTYRVQVTADGTSVMASRAFTRSCIALANDGPGDEKPVMMMITHTLDPVPTEAHVFWSLWAQLPMIVLTTSNRTEWGIENGRIRFVKRIEPTP